MSQIQQHTLGSDPLSPIRSQVRSKRGGRSHTILNWVTRTESLGMPVLPELQDKPGEGRSNRLPFPASTCPCAGIASKTSLDLSVMTRLSRTATLIALCFLIARPFITRG